MTAERPLKPSGIVRALARSAQYAEPFMVTLAIIGIVGNPLFYLVWTLLIPQPFEDLGVRLAISAVCVPIAFHKRWPSALRRWLPLYWHAALLIAVPFQFSLFMFLNQYSLPWVLTVMAGSFLITFFMHWALAVGQYVAGTALAYGVFLMTGWQDESVKIPLEIFVVYLFTLFVGSAVNLRLQRSREAEAAMAFLDAGIFVRARHEHGPALVLGDILEGREEAEHVSHTITKVKRETIVLDDVKAKKEKERETEMEEVIIIQQEQ